MKKELILYIIPTLIYLPTLFKQFSLIVFANKEDKEIVTKILFFVFSIFVISGFWFCYFRKPELAVYFFMGLSLIGLYTYLKK